MPRARLLLFSISLAACDPPAEPEPVAQPTKPGPAVTPEPLEPPSELASEPPKPPSEVPDGEWQRGTIVALPDGTHAIDADDDSVTVCVPDLAPELQKEGLAVKFHGDLEPPIPRDRRWCRIATNLEIAPAE